MRKIALIVAVAMAATAPTAALAAKKPAKVKVYDTNAANHNESSGRFIRDAFWSIGVRGPMWTGKAKMP